MKNIFLFIALAFLGFTSCNDPSAEVYDPADGQIAYFTGGTTMDYYVQDIPNSETTLEVGVTVASNVDRTIALSVDESSTAKENEYTIDNASLFIPANKYVGYIKVKFGSYDIYSQTVPSVLVLNLDEVSGAVVANFDNKYTLNIFQFTPFVRDDMLGTYSVVEYETVDGVEERVDSYESEVTAGSNDNEAQAALAVTVTVKLPPITAKFVAPGKVPALVELACPTVDHVPGLFQSPLFRA